MKATSRMFRVLAALALISVMAGCPAVPPISVDDPVVDTPVKTIVIVSGKLYDPEVKASIRDYGDLLKRNIVGLNFYFYEVGDDQMQHTQSFFVRVIDGSYYAELPVRPGEYNVWIEAVDCFGNVNFYDSSIVTIGSGINKLAVSFAMTSSYGNHFIFPDLVGDFGDYGQAKITTADGQSYWANYEAQYLFGWENPPVMYFTAFLPLSFDGDVQQAVLTIWDSSGAAHVTELNFDLFESASNMMSLPFVYPTWMGEVIPEITFDYESDYYISAGGYFWNSIQEAVDNLPAPVEIEVGKGEYAGYEAYKSVSINGQGAGVTRIIGSDSGKLQVISASMWGTKGGGEAVVVKISNVEIDNGSAQSSGIYSDGAVFVEIGSLEIKNCAVRSLYTSGVVTNYATSVNVNHCVFVAGGSNPETRAVATYNEQGVVVTNSIFMNWNIALFCSNASMTFQYDDFFGCNQPIEDDVPGPNSYSTPGNLWQIDPMLASNYVLVEGSPCTGAGNDDGDIGIDWRSASK